MLRAANQAAGFLKRGVKFESQRPVGRRECESGRLTAGGPGAQLGPPRLGRPELDDQLEVRMLARRIAGGREGLDFADERANDVDGSRNHDAGQVDSLVRARELEPQAAECAQLAAIHRLSQRVDTRMKPQGQVGHDDGPGLGPAEGDLVIRFGVATRRVQADDREALGRGPSEVLSPLFDRASHDRRVDARAGQGVVEITRDRDVRQRRSGEAGKGRDEPMLSTRQQPLRPGTLLAAVTENQDVHYCVIAPCLVCLS